MAENPSSESDKSGGTHIGSVGGDVNFSALGDIVGGNKVTTITTTIQISVEAVTQRSLNPASPYRGLERFEDRDKDCFFGRDQLIKSFLAQLRASKVLLVLGASGSGKSSVVRAGLLPQLTQLIGARFRYFIFVPDVNPFESLRGALLGAGFSQTQTRELQDADPQTPARLIQTLRREGEQWLLFVDQFEEVFTSCDETPRQAFIAALLAIMQDAESPAKLVLAMRADFLDRFSRFPEFAKIVQKEITLVADMHADELRQAIEQPAARHGVVFEQGLVEEIIKDVQGQAGSLPLLQYTLDLLWREEARADGLASRHLTTRAYRELGGVRGALQKRANEIYASFGEDTNGKAASPKQEIVRQIFLRIVDLAGEGSNTAAWRPVRRRAPMAMFATPQEQEILRALINQKLLVSNREGDAAAVEVAHEALFTSWQRAKNWIEAGKQVIFAKNRLADDARRWQSRRQEGDAGADEELLAGSRLSQALDMRSRGDFDNVVGGLGETEAQFLHASAALRDRRAQDEQARRQRELKAAQRLAEVRTLAAARLRTGLLVAVVLLLAAVGFAIYADIQRKNANEKTTQANVARKTAEVEKENTQRANERNLHTLHEASMADYSVAVQRIEKDGMWNEGVAHLVRALKWEPHNPLAATLLYSTLCLYATEKKSLARRNLRHEDEVISAQFSHDGTRLVTASFDKTARVWDTATGKPFGEPLRHEDHVISAQFSHDDTRIVTASFDKTARVWDAATGKPLGGPLRHDAMVLSAQFSQDGTRIVTASWDQTARVWDAATGKPLGEPLRHQDSVVSAQFSPDGSRIVTACHDKTARVWDAATGQQLGEPLRHEATVGSAQFSPDGSRVITACHDKTARVWDAATGQQLGEPLRHDDAIETAQFSPDGSRIVTASWDHTARVWDAASGKLLGEPLRHQDSVVSAQFSPDGSRIVTASNDKTARVWDARSGRPLGELLRHEGFVRSAQFSPDGSRIITASADKTARVWDACSGRPLGEPLRDPLRDAYGVAGARFSPDGSRIIVTFEDKTARVWDPVTGKPLGDLLRDEKLVHSARFNSDGTKIIIASTNTARVWDAVTGKPLGDPLCHEARVISAQFSRDGTRIVTVSADKTARVWDAATGKQLGEPLRHEASVVSAQFSSDGTRIVTASYDMTARVWDAATGKQLGEPLRHETWVISAQFSPDGTKIVTASTNTARVWDTATGKPLGEPLRHGVGVLSAQFSPDGTRIVTTSSGRDQPRVWDVAQLTRAPVPVPEWMRDSASALAGLRFTADGELQPILSDERIATLQEPPPGNDSWAKLARWLVLPEAERTISPNSRFTCRQIAERERDTLLRDGLESSLHYDPTVPLARILLAKFERDTNRVAFLRDYDLQRMPEDRWLWERAVRSLHEQKDVARTQQALNQLTKLAPEQAAKVRAELGL